MEDATAEDLAFFIATRNIEAREQARRDARARLKARTGGK